MRFKGIFGNMVGKVKRLATKILMGVVVIVLVVVAEDNIFIVAEDSAGTVPTIALASLKISNR